MTVTLELEGFFTPTVDAETTNAELNRYGDAGWELVSTCDVNRGQGRTSGIVAIFKRPLD